MAITSRDDLLFHWDQRVLPGAQAIIGGDPSYDCDTARSFVGQDRKIRMANPDGIVVEYETINGVTRPVMPLALARTNLCLWSEDFGTTWFAQGTPTRIAAAIPASVMGVVLDLIGDDDGSSVEYYRQVVTFTGDGSKALSLFLAEGESPPASGSRVQVRDTTAPADRLSAVVTWVDGAPSVNATAGSYLGAEGPLEGGVYRLLFAASGVVAANTNRAEVLPASVVGETGDVYAGGVQAEDGAFPTSYTKTEGSTAARAASLLSFANPPAPQAVVVYASWIEGMGSAAWDNTAYRVWQLGSGSAAAPRFLLYRTTAATLRSQINNNATSTTSGIASTVGVGEHVEAAVVLEADSAQRLVRRIEGGAVAGDSEAALGAGLPSAWSSTARLWFNNVGGGAVGALQMERLIIPKLSAIDAATDGTADEALMDELASVITDKHGNPL